MYLILCHQKILTLGEETINTSVFVQMDAEHVYLMSETLSKFVLVGEPDATVVSSPPAKTLKVALFGSLNRKFKYDIRVHVVDDNGVALEVRTWTSDTVFRTVFNINFNKLCRFVCVCRG